MRVSPTVSAASPRAFVHGRSRLIGIDICAENRPLPAMEYFDAAMAVGCRNSGAANDQYREPLPGRPKKGACAMRYLCLVYVEQGKFDPLSELESQKLTNESLDYDNELRRRGHYITSAALQPVESAATLRMKNGKLSVTD